MSSDSTVTVRTNYRGPTVDAMRWKFDIWDKVTSTWVSVGDNSFAKDWTWSSTEFSLAKPLARFLDGEIVKVRYSTTSKADASLLDELVLVLKGPEGNDSTATPKKPESDTKESRWQPKPGTSWQWQLVGTLDTNVDAEVFDIDLFDVPSTVIDQLHAKGRKVLCYFSAGSYEKWRTDAGKFPASALGEDVFGWENERWLDIRRTDVRNIMRARMDLAESKKCDGVEPDNVDAYTHDSGFNLTASDQIDYNRFLASIAHERNLSIALKNDLGQISELMSDFDFAVNESCMKYSECKMLSPFINAGKAVFHVEYGPASLASKVCPTTQALGIDTLIKNKNLDTWRMSCP